MELLFESRREINKLDGKLRWIQQRPKICEHPVVIPDHSADGAGCSIYGSVFYDKGVYRMWYQGWPLNWTGQNSAMVCYAESDDGLTWRKPSLTLDDRFDAPNNLTNLGLHAPSVFVDPQAPPSHHYRAAGHAGKTDAGAHPDVTQRAYYTSHSSDGLHWTLDQPAPTWRGGDVINSVYHPARKQGIATLKHNVRAGGIRRRALWNAEMINGCWQPDTCALVPDAFDDLCAQARGFASGDYYGMAMQPAGHGTVGFIWQFRHALPRTLSSSGDGHGVFGVVDVSLAYQAEAHSAWLHAPGRLDFISNQDIPWRPHSCVYTAASPTAFGDEHRLYLSATYPHGWYIDAKWKVLEEAKAKLIRRGMSLIGYAAWPAWRIFGYRAEPDGILTLDLGEQLQPFSLSLNYEVHNPDGFVKVALKGDGERTLENCVPLTGSAVGAVVNWQQKGSLIRSTPGQNAAVEIHLCEATLWAWELLPPSPSSGQAG